MSYNSSISNPASGADRTQAQEQVKGFSSSSSNLSSCLLDSGESRGSHSVSPPCAIDWIPSQGENLGAIFGLPSFVSHFTGIAVICCLVYHDLDTVVLCDLSGEFFFFFWLFQMKGNLVFFFLCWLEAEFQII